jgi:addiction module HigA family antidote
MVVTFRPDPNIAINIPPGETLKENMEFLNYSVRDFAKSLEVTEQTLHRIFSGKQPISYETAHKLEMVTGTPSSFWNALEAQYRDNLIIKEEMEEFQRQAGWLEEIPVKELVARKAIENTKDIPTRFKSALRFFKVSSVSAWREIWEKPLLAARRSCSAQSKIGHVAAWVRLGEMAGESLNCAPYDREGFKSLLGDEMQKLTRQDPKVFSSAMVKLCSEVGVALALVPEISKAPLNGATRWITSSKALIVLSIRGKAEDKFWFSFYHEAAHVLNGDGKRQFIISNDDENDPSEQAADKLASDMLIPSNYNAAIKNMTRSSDIISLANHLKISPGIVAGRFRHLTKRWNLHSGLIKKLRWHN